MSIVTNFFKKSLKNHKKLFLIIFVTAIFSFTFEFVNPLILRVIIDDILINKNFQLINLTIIILVILFLVSAVSDYVNSVFINKLQNHVYNDVSINLLDNILSSSVSDYEQRDVGDLMSRVMNNVPIASILVSQTIDRLFMNLLTFIIPIGIMLSIAPFLTIIIVSPALIFLYFNFELGNKVEFYQTKVSWINGLIGSILNEFLSKFLVLKIFNLKEWANNKFKQTNREYCDLDIKHNKFKSLNQSSNYLFYCLMNISFIVFGGRMVINNEMSIGTFSAFFSYIALFFQPISQLSMLWSDYKSSIPAINRINELERFNVGDDNNQEKLEITDGEIKLENVCFAYDKKELLVDFNACFKRGLNYILGENGTGKSTIINLICGLYPLNKGNIFIDNQNIKYVSSKNLLKEISIVFPYPYLFKGSIYENIIMGNFGANKKDVENICKLVKLDEFIRNKKDGFNYDIGESGQFISSGQGQKISLARALIKDSPILLLDEATNFIDEETKIVINNVIDEIKQEKTIIIITHDSSQIKDNSNIINLNLTSP
ncbi:MAG: ABC transporter ATP-binding protein/permease [Methanobrevibacter sp.]|nr:ABC transporter ATP-binding protein/permease [Methanobrevibacter sp.]